MVLDSTRNPDLWGVLEGRVAEPSQGAIDVWERVGELTDPSEFRPRLSPEVEVRRFHLRWGNDYAMAANVRDLLHYRLTPDEADVLALMDGTRTVKELVIEQFGESGALDVDSVADLVRLLLVGGFLDASYVDVQGAAERALAGKRRRFREFVRTQTLEWSGADRLVRWLHDHGLKWFFRPWVAGPSLVVSVAGVVAFVALVRSQRFDLSGRSLLIGFVLLLVLNYFLTFVHELGHSLVLVANGRRIKSAGFQLYFGSPAWFVDCSDGLMMDRRHRMLSAAAGPYAETIVAGGAAMIAWAFPGLPVSPTLYKFAALNYLVLFMNLVPFLELDGYWLLSDGIQVPDLRPRSLAFVRHDLLHRLRHGPRLSRQEVGLSVYAILGIAFTVLSFYTAYFFWRNVFGPLLTDLWQGGWPGRVILAVLGVVIVGPLVRGLLKLMMTIARRVRTGWRRARFRWQRSWRVEAAEMIDALPLFDDVPDEVLSHLAGRVRLRTVAAGQSVFRQGDRPDAVYVVRRGVLQVVDDAAGKTLRSLTRGDSFGEMGLIEAAPRSATVRAVRESQLFEVDKGTFGELLADMAAVPNFAPTLQAATELGELPCFAHLGPEQLLDLLHYGTWRTVAPGEVLVTQGEVGDTFYAIGHGQAEVARDGRRVRVLGAGSHFGEIALLSDERRTATVRALTPARMFGLHREGFDRLVAGALRHSTAAPPQGAEADRTWEH
jgi:CRP-like cAMP-binding protein